MTVDGARMIDLAGRSVPRLGYGTMRLTGPQARAWLLARSPSIVAIPGTSNVVHLEENLASGDLELSVQDLANLDVAG